MSPHPNPNPGIVTIPSRHSVDATVEKLKGILQAKGVKLFALIDHGGEAKKAGLQMPPTKLLIFGNPQGGTPLMLASPSVALDLENPGLGELRGQGLALLQRPRLAASETRFTSGLGGHLKSGQ